MPKEGGGSEGVREEVTGRISRCVRGCIRTCVMGCKGASVSVREDVLMDGGVYLLSVA